MHAWAEACHLLQSSKSPLTGFLCSIYWLKNYWPDQVFFKHSPHTSTLTSPLASFPGLHAQLLSLAVRKAGKAWTDLSRDACHGWRHVQSAHVWVCSLPFTLLSLNSVHSFCSVCPASPIATGSIVASYSTWCQPQHASCDKSVQAFPCFSYCKWQKLGVEAWERG